MQANGVNYYKGVLLCSRPNQSPSVQRDKYNIFLCDNRPFCGRVQASQQLGLVPTKQYGERKTRKRQLPVLNNHKKWLEKFKNQISLKKGKQQEQEKRKQQALQKIRQQGRDKIKQVTLKNSNQFNANNNESVIKQHINNYPQQQTKKQQKKPQVSNNNAHKKKSKPVWAQTQQQHHEQQLQQADQLLDFFQKGETEQVKDYLNDDSVKKILQQLKKKIESLREKGDQWKKNEMIKIEEQDDKRQDAQQRRRRQNNNGDKDDILSRISKQSGSQSVSSQKTVDRVQQLEKKKQTKEWDKLTTTSKSSLASVDEQIAKHIADQILRNYPNLKHHSNHSIRKLLEKQAREELKSK